VVVELSGRELMLRRRSGGKLGVFWGWGRLRYRQWLARTLARQTGILINSTGLASHRGALRTIVFLVLDVLLVGPCRFQSRVFSGTSWFVLFRRIPFPWLLFQLSLFLLWWLFQFLLMVLLPVFLLVVRR